MVDQLEAQLRLRPGNPVEPPGPEVRRAAVAAVFRPGGELLFIRRSEREGDPWSGHMAFPGGRLEPRDPSLLAAAQRETWEEVGLELDQRGRLLGPLDEVITPMRRGPVAMVISPFAFAVDGPVDLTPNYEVASTHWFSIERLASGEGRNSFELEWRGQRLEFPCIDLDGVRIWGLTLRMLDDMLERIGGQVSPPVRAR